MSYNTLYQAFKTAFSRFIFEISEVPREPDLPMIRHCLIEMILKWLLVKKYIYKYISKHFQSK